MTFRLSEEWCRARTLATVYLMRNVPGEFSVEVEKIFLIKC